MSERITNEKFEALRNGDHLVFDEIFCENYNKIKYFIYKTIRSEDDAEELTQDVFVKLWENRESLTSPETLFAYIFKLAKSSVCRYIAKKSSERNYVNNEKFVRDDSSNSIEESIYAEELDLLISMTVSKMPSQRRKIYELSRIQELSNSEISHLLKISKRTVEAHLYQAMKEIYKVINTLLIIIYAFFY